MLSLLAESWTWYAFATLIVASRFVSRWLQLGSIKSFQTEDYLMLIVFGFYTTLISVMNIVAHLDTNLMDPSDILKLTPASIASRVHGSKLVLVVEQSMIATQWGCKICLLILYSKLTFGLKQELAVKILMGYVIGNWLVMEILYFGVWCRPFHDYWEVPVANEQCSAALHHLITNAVFNISSDVMMLCIPLPLLLATQLPTTKKALLCILFSLGIFVILCACLNKYYSFRHPFSPMWTFWYIREASTAIYVANMPMCWALVRRIFRVKRFDGHSDEGTLHGTEGFERGQRRRSSRFSVNDSSADGDRGWLDRGRSGNAGTEIGFGELHRTETEDFIIANMNGSGRGRKIDGERELQSNSSSTVEDVDGGSKRAGGDEELGVGQVRAW